MSAVTVTAVAGVAAAGAAAYGAYSQNQAAKDAQEQSKNNAQALYGSKVDPVPYDDRLDKADSYARTLPDLVNENARDSLPAIFDIRRKVQRETTQNREQMAGGHFRETMQQEGANISSMLQGQIPKDVMDSINRIVAENLGGAFDASKGNSAVAADAARRLGLTSLDLMKTGMSFAPAWRNSVDSFIYKPQDVMKDFITPGAAVALDASKIQMQRDENEYYSANNISRAEASPDPAARGQFQDSMTLGVMERQSQQNMANALIGLVTGGANAYNSIGGGTGGIYTGSAASYGLPALNGNKNASVYRPTSYTLPK